MNIQWYLVAVETWPVSELTWHIMLRCLFGRVWTSLCLPVLWICENTSCASPGLHHFQAAAGVYVQAGRQGSPRWSGAPHRLLSKLLQAHSLASFIICTFTLSLKQALRTWHKHICFDFCVSNIFSIKMDCMFSVNDYTYKDIDSVGCGTVPVWNQTKV